MITWLVALGCGDPAVEVLPPPPPSAAVVDVDVDLGPSLYELPVELRDQNDVAITLDAHRGHPVIVSMIYTACTSVCPMTTSRIKKIEEALPPAVRADTRVLLVSLDPARDDAPALRAMLEEHGADATRWTLARTDEDHVREVAAVLGVRYRPMKDGEVDHSVVISVLDRDGRVVARQEGLADPIDAIVAAIVKQTTGS